ncbi:histidinol phosphate phosphatase [Porphyromonas gingivalis SJD12]|nr:histidinol phosphate phosphatase [Porphyromonas gingivalis SJD12]SJL22904.1 histone-like family DNA-binding protein [Porphyromonas gingivalis]
MPEDNLPHLRARITIGAYYYNMADKSIQFSLTERNLLGKDGKRHKMQVAVPTGRKRIGFRSFCARVAKSTTFNEQEVAAVLNYATGIAKDIVSEGDIVEFGDLGTLSPTFKSKAVPLNEKFRAQEHILAPAVRLTPSKKYFTLMNVTFEQIKSKKENTENPPSDTGGSTPSGPEQGGGSGGL